MKLQVLLLAVCTSSVLGAFLRGISTDDAYDGYEVQQIHMAQGRDPTAMTISWITTDPAETACKFGITKDTVTTVTGVSSSYKYNYQDLGLYESGTIHHVYLTGLKADTPYVYQCGDFDRAQVSGMQFFRTLHAVGSRAPMHFGVVGDLGTSSDSASTIRHMANNNALGMILHAGDLSYADCTQPVWDSYGQLIEDLAKERPWMVGPGNHEIEFNSDGSMYLAFEERYKMPAVRPAELGKVTIPPAKDSKGNPYCASSVFQSEYNYGNSFYSFDAGSAHVIYLNPYSTSDASSVQYQWLLADLEAVDREVTPWLIVVMHCPWYSSNQAHYGEQQAVMMRDSMEEVFFKNHVNLVFTGHVHAYERTYPVFKNETRADGVVYVTIGDGGNREGHAATYYEQPAWSAYRNGTQYGHGQLSLWSKDKLTWRWFRNVDGQIFSKDELLLCNSAFGPVTCA